MVDRKELQLKIWNAVKGYTLSQIQSATPAQLATAAGLTAEEIAVAKNWKNLIMFRLIAAKKAQRYTQVKDDVVGPALVSIIDTMVNDREYDRLEARRELQTILEEILEAL